MMFPEMGFSWGGFSLHLHAYTLFMFLSIGLGLLLTFFKLRQSGMPAARAQGFCFAVGISFVVGARLLNYALNQSRYSQMGISILEPRLSYFSLYGGILLSTAVLYLLVKWNRLPIKAVFDGLILPFLFSFSLMKIGCFLNGCCYGTRTTVFFGVPLPLSERQLWTGNSFVTKLLSIDQIRVYPVQLMEALAAVAVALFLFSFRKHLREGSAFYAAAFLFSGARLGLLQIRSTSYSPFVVEQMYPTLYACIMVFGLIMFIRNERR